MTKYEVGQELRETPPLFPAPSGASLIKPTGTPEVQPLTPEQISQLKKALLPTYRFAYLLWMQVILPLTTALFIVIVGLLSSPWLYKFWRSYVDWVKP